MLTRIVCGVLGYALLAASVAMAQAPSDDDATKAEVDKLRAQAQALLAEAQAREAQARQAKSAREATEKYMRALAEACLEAVVKGDHEAILPVMTEELKVTFLVDNRNPLSRQSLDVVRRRGISVSDYKITSTVIAPTLEEGLFRAAVTGKSTVPDEQGKDKVVSIVLRIQKEKGRYVLGFLSTVLVK
jgi:hypothetical protein